MLFGRKKTKPSFAPRGTTETNAEVRWTGNGCYKTVPVTGIASRSLLPVTAALPAGSNSKGHQKPLFGAPARLLRINGAFVTKAPFGCGSTANPNPPLTH